MKLIFKTLVLAFLLSCNNHPEIKPANINNEDEAALNQQFTVIPNIILSDYNKWYNYTYRNIRLSQDFIGLDIDSTKIDKETFLRKLMTKKVVAFKIRLFQGEPVYKLYKLYINNENIKSTIEQLASIEMKNDKMEGQQIPEFNFTDIEENNYSSNSTKGKILLLKCWFISCTACAKEFPECNKLLDKYKNRKDVLFISLAIDSKDELKKFSKAEKFKYAIVPEMDNYMTSKLNVNMYPTHLLINKTGKIIKVVNSVEEIEPFLKKEIEK